MTATSELFVDEDLRDYIQDHYKKYKNCAVKIPKDWMGIWDMMDFPTHIETTIYDYDDDDQTPLATITARIRVSITNGMDESEESPDIEILDFNITATNYQVR
jgi:hypothetical protein